MARGIDERMAARRWRHPTTLLSLLAAAAAAFAGSAALNRPVPLPNSPAAIAGLALTWSALAGTWLAHGFATPEAAL